LVLASELVLLRQVLLWAVLLALLPVWEPLSAAQFLRDPRGGRPRPLALVLASELVLLR
jgi:hypothetical protein